jgi:hypothetical protein
VTASCAPMQMKGGVFNSSRNRAERLKAVLPWCLFVAPAAGAFYVIDNIFWNAALGKPPESGCVRAFGFKGSA